MLSVIASQKAIPGSQQRRQDEEHRQRRKDEPEGARSRAPQPVGLRLSRHSHIIAIIDVSGSEATSPPQPGYRRAISATAAAMRPDRPALMTK